MYVDHAATTPERPEVLAAMLPYFAQEWGNPWSLYGPGHRAAQAVGRARDTVADILGCTREEVVFTGSGSEGANLAIKGVALAAAAAGKRHLITSRVEQHAVLDEFGEIDLAHLDRSITDRTALVSVMYPNNEVGTIQPLQDGMIGSRRRVYAVFKLLRDEGVAVEDLLRVHAPIGLDIKSATPGEIAVSVGAEPRSMSDILRPQYRYSRTKVDQDI